MQQQCSKFALLAAGILAAAFSGNAAAYAVMWQNGQITTLGAPAGVDPAAVSATAINDNGQVLLSYSTTVQNNFGAVWNNGNYTVLSNLVGGATTDQIHASNLNNSGQVVGYITDNFGQNARAATWDSNGVASLLSTPAGTANSYAHHINDSGQIVGVSYDANGQASALLWGDDGYTDLGLFPGDYTGGPSSINNLGVAVGNSGNISATQWSNGTLTDLGVLPGWQTSYATDVNNNGWAVGASSKFGGLPPYSAATVWHDGQTIDLGMLPGASGGSYAAAINDFNQIVGTTQMGGPNGYRATLWQNGQIIDLGGLQGATRYDANDINNLGWIVGRSDGMAPVPLPGAVWLLGSALFGVLGLKRRGTLATA